tara:strand:- start:18308 stop:18910 length:603 start_codon:yes stop_codon:yes gene_type:complete
MAMSLKVIVPPHPLIKHWLSILRDKDTPNILYSTAFEQIGRWLTYEALRDWLPFRKEFIETNNGKAEVFFIDNNYPIRIIAQIPEGLTLWYGSKEVIPNAILSLGKTPVKILKNEGVIIYSEQIMHDNNPLQTLKELEILGVESNRILLISSICSNKGLNKIAKFYPNQVIYTSCIDNEDNNNLIPGIGNPIFRLSTMFR